MPPKPSHTVIGCDHNDAISADWSRCLGCNLCTTKCTFDVLKKEAVKIPPFLNANRDNAVQGNSDTTRVLLDDTNCVGCGQCTTVCNMGALVPVDHIERVFAAKAAGKTLVAMVAPASRVGIAEAMGMEIGSSAMAQLVSSLRKIGFDYVFDVNTAADKTTLDDLDEVLALRKAGKGPAITSCCPAWIELLEKEYPQLIPQTSTAKSPIGTLASLVKNVWAAKAGLKKEDLYTVGVMPCVAKKAESSRKQLHEDYDASLTVNEVAAYFKKQKVDAFTAEAEEVLAKTEDGQCDLPFRSISGGSNIFAKTAGVSETVLRVIAHRNNVPFNMADAEKEVLLAHPSGSALTKFKVEIAGEKYAIAVAHGGFAIRKACEMMLNKELDVDCVEMMACVGGCQNGAGQPKVPPAKKALIANRTVKLDQLDNESSYKTAAENTDLLALLENISHEEQHHMLHTSYSPRYE